MPVRTGKGKATEGSGVSGAICTKGEPRRKLTNTISATVGGPVSVSVADARAREGSDETIDFAVTLSRAAAVAYATADGSATAGSDYTARKGELTFDPGETAKTVSVAVLDDAHDEGEETMRLRLSAASGAVIADGVATGTIENTDHMPAAWMVRFGRTVGSPVVDALGERLEGGAPSHVTVGGIRITGAPGVVPEADTDDPFGLPEWATKIHREEAARTLTRDDLLLRSAFHLSSGGGEAAEPAFTTWGRVSMSGFEAEVDDVTMDGDVTTGLIGFDAEWERVLAGVMVSQSSGDGSYRLDPAKGGDAGSVKSSLTGVYPYVRVDLNAKVSAWALAGVGLRGMEDERGHPRDPRRLGAGPDAVHRACVGPHGERRRAALVRAEAKRTGERLRIRAGEPARDGRGLRLRPPRQPRRAHALRGHDARGCQGPHGAHRDPLAARHGRRARARDDPADE